MNNTDQPKPAEHFILKDRTEPVGHFLLEGRTEEELINLFTVDERLLLIRHHELYGIEYSDTEIYQLIAIFMQAVEICRLNGTPVFRRNKPGKPPKPSLYSAIVWAISSTFTISAAEEMLGLSDSTIKKHRKRVKDHPLLLSSAQNIQFKITGNRSKNNRKPKYLFNLDDMLKPLIEHKSKPTNKLLYLDHPEWWNHPDLSSYHISNFQIH